VLCQLLTNQGDGGISNANDLKGSSFPWFPLAICSNQLTKRAHLSMEITFSFKKIENAQESLFCKYTILT
jgi:hypothetical protein